MRGLIYFFGILCFIYYTYSKPNGAPQDSCFYMTPRHIHPHTFRRVFPTKAMGLYNITTSADVFRPDRPIRVTLWGPPFKGFMLVAAEEGAKDWPTGIFYSEDGAAKRISCLARGDTVTHQNNSYKDSVSVLWYGPENMMSEQIQFIATVVVNLTIYYTNIRSGMIRLDPSLHGTTLDPEAAAGAGGEGGAPVAVTMDPWLSGQSATQAPTNWWSNLAGTGGGRRNTWGNTNTGWGTGGAAGNNGWGANAGSGSNTGGSWGTNTGTSGGWGSQSGAGTNGGWGSQTGSSGSGGWGSQSGTGGTGGTGGWGSQSSSGGWGTGGSGNNQWGASQGSGGWGSNTGQSWGQQSSGTGTGAGGNSWGSNGDWQQVNQGSVTSSSWNAGQTSWHAPGDGRPIWNWNSGKIETTPAPATTKAPQPANNQSGKQTTPASAWSAQALLELVQRLGFGPVARAP